MGCLTSSSLALLVGVQAYLQNWCGLAFCSCMFLITLVNGVFGGLDKRAGGEVSLLTLRASVHLEDWYALDGGGNWASVEGTAEQWRDVARVLLGELPEVRHKRLACARVVISESRVVRGFDGFALHSPRNACGPNDTVYVLPADAAALAAEVSRAIGDGQEAPTEALRGRSEPGAPTEPPAPLSDFFGAGSAAAALAETPRMARRVRFWRSKCGRQVRVRVDANDASSMVLVLSSAEWLDVLRQYGDELEKRSEERLEAADAVDREQERERRDDLADREEV